FFFFTSRRRHTISKRDWSSDVALPIFILHTFDLTFGIFDIRRHLTFNKLFHDERFEEFERHFPRQTALVHFEGRAYDDNRTAGIVDTLTEQILTETSLLTFEHV